jgi:hypothetical protein
MRKRIAMDVYKSVIRDNERRLAMYWSVFGITRRNTTPSQTQIHIINDFVV